MISQDMGLFGITQTKVFVSLHYWKWSFRNTLKYGISLQILLINLLSPSFDDYLHICMCMCIFM